MVKVAIRDDDLNFFTTTEEIETAYKDIIDSVPIGFAVIPFIHKSQLLLSDKFVDYKRNEQLLQLKQYEEKLKSEDMEDYLNINGIGKNEKMVSYLKKLISKGNVEIYMHGITHRFYSDGAEFVGDHVSYQDIRFAKNYLEKVFNYNLKYFVPPSNALSFKNLFKVYDNGLNVLISSNIVRENKYEELQYGIKLLKKNSFIDLSNRKKIRQYKYYMPNGNHIINCFTFSKEDTIDSFLGRYNLIDNLPSKLVIATHYTNHLDYDCWLNFKKLISFLEEEGASFVKASEL